MQGYEITTIVLAIMVASHLRKVGGGGWESLCARNHPATALQRWLGDLPGLMGLKVLLPIALPVPVSQLATPTRRA